MQTFQADLAIVGAGGAGLRAAIAAAQPRRFLPGMVGAMDRKAEMAVAILARHVHAEQHDVGEAVGAHVLELILRERDAVGAHAIVLGRVEDEPAPAAADVEERLARRELPLEDAMRPLYHAAAVFASNDVVAVSAIAERLFAAAGVPEPAAAINDAIVQIHASGYVPTELEWPSTWTDRRNRDRTPSIPGHELAGVVTALGYGTTGLSVGQRVFGLADWYRDGTLAEYVAMEARNLAPLPGDVDFTVGASLPISGLTAWQGLFQHGRLQAGQSVLVHGAAGVVGQFLEAGSDPS